MNLRTLTLAAAALALVSGSALADSNGHGPNSGGSHGNSGPVSRPNSVQSGQQTQASFDASKGGGNTSTGADPTPAHCKPDHYGSSKSDNLHGSWGIGADQHWGGRF